MGQTLAHRVGSDPRFGHDTDSEIVVFEPHAGKDWRVANVDTTIKPGILRAKELGLVQSHTTDLIFTMEPQFAGQELYDEMNKGRFLALFRHPVERATSMFYYLQSATWERTYRPEWADMSVIEWANQEHQEEDYMVHKLTGKKFGDAVDETDLIIAKELVRQRFIVGLMGEMKESVRRFNIVLGVDEHSERSQQCMEEFGLVIEEEKPKEGVTPIDAAAPEEEEERSLATTDKKNSNKHPKVLEGSPEFDAIAARNRLDMLLYKYIESLFDAQKEIVDSFLEPEVIVQQQDPAELQEEIISTTSSSRLGAPREAEVVEEEEVVSNTNPNAEEVVVVDEHEAKEDDLGTQIRAAEEALAAGKQALVDLAAEEEGSEKLSSMRKFKPNGIIPAAQEDEETSGFKIPQDVQSHLVDITDSVDLNAETPFFWHVPKSGGTTLQRLYWCMGSTIANEVGVNPKFGVNSDELSPIVAFKPWSDNPGQVVNVDVCTNDGIIQAKNRGFLSPGKDQPAIDFVSTSEFHFASQMLYSPEYKARMFGMFRHPVERAVSKFYYLQKATWEPTYNTKWAEMSLAEYATRDRGDANWMVRNLVGKTGKGAPELIDDDLELAKEIIRTKFVVGLMDDFSESVHRFNVLLGFDESDLANRQCMEEFSSSGGDSDSKKNKKEIKVKNMWNSYEHPKADRGGAVWKSLYRIHKYDCLLYNFISDQFKSQASLFSADNDGNESGVAQLS